MASIIEEESRQAAQNFREENHLGLRPIGNLVTVIERTVGCDVAVIDASPDEHGLSMRDPVRERIFIGVARTKNPMRQRSSLAHELAHVLFQDWDAGLQQPGCQTESRADAFARHLLIPAKAVSLTLGETKEISLEQLSILVQQYLVSPAIAAIQLRDSGYIDTATAKSWMRITSRQLATRFGWIDHYEAIQEESNKVRAPQMLLARAIEGHIEGVVSAQTIATLRSKSLDSVLEDFEEADVFPLNNNPADLAASDLPEVEIDLSDLDDALYITSED